MLSHTKRHDRFDIAHSVVKSLSRTFAGWVGYVETFDDEDDSTPLSCNTEEDKVV